MNRSTFLRLLPGMALLAPAFDVKASPPPEAPPAPRDPLAHLDECSRATQRTLRERMSALHPTPVIKVVDRHGNPLTAWVRLDEASRVNEWQGFALRRITPGTPHAVRIQIPEREGLDHRGNPHWGRYWFQHGTMVVWRDNILVTDQMIQNGLGHLLRGRP